VRLRQIDSVSISRDNCFINRIARFICARQEANAANAAINRELAAPKRAFTLALQAGKLVARPHIPMLEEHNVRTGFFEPAQFESIRNLLRPHLRPLITFAYITGWRTRSEVFPPQWRQVDFAAGRVCLDPGTTKNGEGRQFPFTAELRALLEAQKAETEAFQKHNGKLCPWVFHRKGQPIRDFRTAWRNACTKAALPGRIPHDFRRTAVRNLVRAGIPERVAMQMTGHKTRSVFERYNIVSEGDLTEAARKLDEVSGQVLSKVATRRSGVKIVRRAKSLI
jgi:integrase